MGSLPINLKYVTKFEIFIIKYLIMEYLTLELDILLKTKRQLLKNNFALFERTQ